MGRLEVYLSDKHERNSYKKKTNLKMAGEEYKNCYMTKVKSATEREEHKLQLEKAKEKNEGKRNEVYYVVRAYKTKWEIVGIPKRK